MKECLTEKGIVEAVERMDASWLWKNLSVLNRYCYENKEVFLEELDNLFRRYKLLKVYALKSEKVLKYTYGNEIKQFYSFYSSKIKSSLVLSISTEFDNVLGLGTFSMYEDITVKLRYPREKLFLKTCCEVKPINSRISAKIAQEQLNKLANEDYKVKLSSKGLYDWLYENWALNFIFVPKANHDPIIKEYRNVYLSIQHYLNYLSLKCELEKIRRDLVKSNSKVWEEPRIKWVLKNYEILKERRYFGNSEINFRFTKKGALIGDKYKIDTKEAKTGFQTLCLMQMSIVKIYEQYAKQAGVIDECEKVAFDKRITKQQLQKVLRKCFSPSQYVLKFDSKLYWN